VKLKLTTLEGAHKPSEGDKIIEKVIRNLQERSVKSLEIAKETILGITVECEEINEALKHYTENWNDYVHPGLISIACEAVGGNPEEAIPMQVIMLLLSAAFDMHDDIIDESKTKYGKLTVVGKFSKDIALLVGDAFLMKAFSLLRKLEKQFPTEIMNDIWNIITTRFFELGDAEALEASLRGDVDVSAEECLRIFEKKASTLEAHMQIGAIIGDGKKEDVKLLGNYGRTLGVLMGVREDFIDVFEPEELQNRMKNECLPLPILYALKEPLIKKPILTLLSKQELSKKDVERIVDLVFEAEEVKIFVKRFQGWAGEALKGISRLKRNTIRLLMENLIKGMLEDIEET